MGDNIAFFDQPFRDHLKPLSFTKPVSELRSGILTIREKWEINLSLPSSWVTVDYLAQKYADASTNDTLFIYGGCLPTDELLEQVRTLKRDESIWSGDNLVVFRGNRENLNMLLNNELFSSKRFELEGEPLLIKYLYHFLDFNALQIKADFSLLSHARKSMPISDTVMLIGNQHDDTGHPQIFIEEGAIASFVTINVTKGPVYIGLNAEIMEGSLVRGPVAICRNGVVNMGTKIYGGTTIGPWCKVGGELNNAILNGYSNKGHDGFLGDSVIGEWCNIGADSNTSNLKNDYSEVKLWDYAPARFIKTGRQFCGLIMGDHSKSAINTMFNTGTVTGVAANIALGGFPRNFIPSFTLSTAKGIHTVNLEAAISVAERVMARRGLMITEIDRAILSAIFNETLMNRVKF